MCMVATTPQNAARPARSPRARPQTGSQLAVKAERARRGRDWKRREPAECPCFSSFCNYLHASMKSLTVFEIREWKERLLRALVLILDAYSNGGCGKEKTRLALWLAFIFMPMPCKTQAAKKACVRETCLQTALLLVLHKIQLVIIH